MDKDAFRSLLDKAFADRLDKNEREELIQYLSKETEDDVIAEMLGAKWKTFKSQKTVISKATGEKMLQHILLDAEEDSSSGKINAFFSRSSKLMAACVLAIFVLVAAYVLNKSDDFDEVTLSEAIERSGIRPGSDKATIYLSDGSSVVLGDSDDELLALDNGVRIINLRNGVVLYEVAENASAELAYNTIKTPKGGQYKVQLEDGTKVHLNAESTLRFPIQFPEERREVNLEGEGYFEVVAGESRPFYVKTPLQEVRVLGTVFNIKAYPDLNYVKTILVEGRVDVLCARESENNVALSPGEAAVSNMDCGSIEVVDCDLDEELAWHNGYFIFTNEPIVEIMSRVARWYDVEIAYEGDMDDVRLGGIFQRSKSIDQLLESFKATGLVNFYIEERRVTVMRK